MSPPFPCTTANLPVILWVILDPPPKRHYQQLKNSGCLSTGLPPGPCMMASSAFHFYLFPNYKNVKQRPSRLLLFVNSRDQQ
jgi:hypothetical protein